MAEYPNVTIVILNWNNAPDTLVCLESVSRIDYPNFCPLVVDNGSTDGSVEQIYAGFPHVEVLETGANLGYAGGNNVGIQHALAAGADYIFVLNNDTVVASTILTELVHVGESLPHLGMAGPCMLCMGQDEIVFAAGSFINWASGETWHREMFRPRKVYEAAAAPEQVDFITGCGVLIRRELIEAAGMFDASYFLNFEDVEWSVRARRYGFSTWYVPQAVMWHKVSATLGQESPANAYYFTRNRLRFFWENAPSHVRLLALVRVLAVTLRTAGAWSVLPQYRSATFRRRRDAYLLGVRDFFLGRSGPMGPDVARTCSRS